MNDNLFSDVVVFPHLFPGSTRNNDPLWIVKEFLETLHNGLFIRHISEILDGESYITEYSACEFPDNLDEWEEPFTGARVRFLDDEIVISEETLRDCIKLACQRYLELYPHKKPEMAEIMEKLTKSQ